MNLPTSTTLRETTHEDIAILFDQQNDADAHKMVGVTSHAPDDRNAFYRKWEKALADENVIARTILHKDEIAGSINSFHAPWSDALEIGYWLGRQFWGKGIATRALEEFLKLDPRRPMGATAVVTNKGSIAVLKKCGFRIIDTVEFELNDKPISEHRFVLE